MFAIRVFGDFLHVLSFAVLLAKLWRTKSCAGISGKSQILYAIVFTMRYLDLPVNISADAFYLSSMKVVYIAISFMIVYMIYGISGVLRGGRWGRPAPGVTHLGVTPELMRTKKKI
uniref:ER lumen protein-retaining receptor 1-B n=2 Tax=Culex pipiens TaxID=7175 RepID=A0A8D8CMD1_CULPI